MHLSLWMVLVSAMIRSLGRRLSSCQLRMEESVFRAWALVKPARLGRVWKHNIFGAETTDLL